MDGYGPFGVVRLPATILDTGVYAFVKERIISGDCKTPTDVVCAALPYLRAERDASNAKPGA